MVRPLDQHLLPHDGIEATREILVRLIVPLVLLIGYPAAGLVRRAQEAGILANLVFTRPRVFGPTQAA